MCVNWKTSSLVLDSLLMNVRKIGFENLMHFLSNIALGQKSSAKNGKSSTVNDLFSVRSAKGIS